MTNVRLYNPFIRLENALWNVFFYRENQSVAVLTNLWEIWSLQPKLHRRILASRSTLTLCKVAVLRILRAVSIHSLPIHQLHTLLHFLHSVVSESVLLQQFTKQLDAASTIDGAQLRFSEFTSGWKLCNNLCDALSCSLIASQEYVIDGLDFRVLQDINGGLVVTDDNTRSVVSAHSVAATQHSMAPSTHGKFKRAHCQPTITKNAIQEDGKHPNFRLKTLEEHRHATRFQKKHVTLKTWRPALCEAHILIKSGDRVSLAKALYLLLEIIWIDPRGCNLATVYLDAGSIYLEFDHLQEATKAYRNCLRLDGANWKARYNLGVATARLQDFIEATRQLTLAFKASPADIADEIAKMLKEIEHIQYSKNLQAYKEATKARVFTTQFLESRHLVGGKLGVSNLQEDHTVSHRNGLSLSSSTPQLLDTSNKWQGVLASVLHRLHAFARCRDIDIQYEMLRLDPKWTSGVSIETLNELTKQITGTSLSVAERNVMLGNYGTTTFHYFSPNAESCHAFDEIHDQDGWIVVLVRADDGKMG
ncbi:hypothetical protein PInf_024282 [Phytophthora infestans]|nr:hypothetical protein PInf_024282 [Phytophthora infestans]